MEAAIEITLPINNELISVKSFDDLHTLVLEMKQQFMSLTLRIGCILNIMQAYFKDYNGKETVHAYCKEEFNWKSNYTNKIMRAANILTVIHKRFILEQKQKNFPLPTTEAMLRKFKKQWTVDEICNVWKKCVEFATKEKRELNATIVEEAIADISESEGLIKHVGKRKRKKPSQRKHKKYKRNQVDPTAHHKKLKPEVLKKSFSGSKARSHSKLIKSSHSYTTLPLHVFNKLAPFQTYCISSNKDHPLNIMFVPTKFQPPQG